MSADHRSLDEVLAVARAKRLIGALSEPYRLDVLLDMLVQYEPQLFDALLATQVTIPEGGK